jgi:hypothetical protein
MSRIALHVVLVVLGLCALCSCALVVSFDDLEREPRSLRGTVSGLDGELVLLRLGNEDRMLGNGPFAFDRLRYGSAYSLEIAKQPPAHHCSIRGGQGTMAGFDVAGVDVFCRPK